MTSKAYLPLNVFSYLFRPVGLACRLPFITALYDIGAHGFPHGVHFPPGYTTHEPQAGLFVTAPWTWLTLVALFFAGRAVVRWWRWWRASGQTGSASPTAWALWWPTSERGRPSGASPALQRSVS